MLEHFGLQGLNAFLQAGGPLLWALALVSLLMWTLILERYWYLRRVYPRRARAWVDEWTARSDHGSWFARRIREGLISQAKNALDGTLPVISTLIALCPLLGVLGTVTGMINVFDVIAVKGTGDARAMASGVASATIPTMAGMVVALSGIYFGVRLKRRVETETEHLADQLPFK